jgi:hypothetical protein
MQTAAPLAREKLFNMRMSVEEWDRLDSLAKHYGLNAAGIVRMLVKERCDTLAVEIQGKIDAAKKHLDEFTRYHEQRLKKPAKPRK